MSTSSSGSCKESTAGGSVSALSACGSDPFSDGLQRCSFPRPNYSDTTQEKPSTSLYYPPSHASHRLSSRHHSDRDRYVAWLASGRQSCEMRVTGDDRRTCRLNGCGEMFGTQEEMLAHTYKCEWFNVRGEYRCPCGILVKLKCDRKERLANAIWQILSMVGVVRQNEHSVRLPSGPPSYPSPVRSRTIPENASDYQKYLELPTPYYPPIPEPSDCTELSGTSIFALELDTVPIFELPSSPRHSGKPVNYKASSSGHNSRFSMSRGNFMRIQETNFPTDHVRTKNSPTLMSAINTSQVPSRDNAPYCSPTHMSSYCASQDQRTTPNDLDLVSPQSSWTSPDVSDRQGSSFDSASSYPPETAPIWSTPTTSQGSHDDPNASQPLKDFPLDDFFTQSHVRGLDTMLGYEEAFGHEPQLNLEESFDATNEYMNSILEEMLQKQYTEEIAVGMNIYGDVLDHSPHNPIDDKNCCLEHGHSCFPSSTSGSLSRGWKSSEQLIDDFETAHSLFLKDIQLKLPGIEAVKFIPQLENMSRDPAACLERGLDVFREILKEGKKPDTIEDVFGFLTTVYASAAILHNDLTTLNMVMWFQEALCWVAPIGDLHHKELYLKVIAGIWQARFGASVLSTVEKPRAAASLSIKENKCVKILQNLLDALDHLRFSEGRSRSGSSTSSFAGDPNFVNMAQSLVFGELKQNIEVQPYMESIHRIEWQVANGSIRDSRTLEIELINASELLCDTQSRLKLVSLVTKSCDKLYDQEGWKKNPRTTSHIEGIERLRIMVNEARWNDIEAAIIPDFLNQSPNWEDSPPDVNMDFDYETPLSPLTAQRSDNFPSRYPGSNINPFASSPSQSSSPNGPESPTSPTSQGPTNTSMRCPICNHAPTGDWRKGNLKRHINEKHAIKDGSLTCGHNGCPITFTRPENMRTHQREIHKVGPPKKARRKSVKGRVQPRKSSSASTETQSSAEG